MIRHSLRELLSRERLAAHDAWLKRGRTGTGRLELENFDFSSLGGYGQKLDGARLVRCRFDDADLTYSYLEGCELIECSALRARLSSISLETAVVERSKFAGANLSRMSLDRARIVDCDFEAAALGRSSITAATVERVTFRGARLVDAKLDRAHFIDCDFSQADFSEVDQLLEHGTTTETRFERCRFDGANFAGRRLERTVFEDCSFAGVTGQPNLTGPITVIPAGASPWG